MYTCHMICYTEWLEDKVLKFFENTKGFFQMFAPVQLMKASDKGKEYWRNKGWPVLEFHH